MVTRAAPNPGEKLIRPHALYTSLRQPTSVCHIVAFNLPHPARTKTAGARRSSTGATPRSPAGALSCLQAPVGPGELDGGIDLVNRPPEAALTGSGRAPGGGAHGEHDREGERACGGAREVRGATEKLTGALASTEEGPAVVIWLADERRLLRPEEEEKLD